MSAIDNKYDDLLRRGLNLGMPLDIEQPGADGVGSFRIYEVGRIFYHPSFGAFELHGAIGAKYVEIGAEASDLSYPISDETDMTDGSGRFNSFQFGTINWVGSTQELLVHIDYRGKFLMNVGLQNWESAFLLLNRLNMTDILQALDELDQALLQELWNHRQTYSQMVDLDRIDYARKVVTTRCLPTPIGDLLETGQVSDAANFLASKFTAVAMSVNPHPEQSISLILQECRFYDIEDKSHIAYILATAHHESHMGKDMTEWADGSAYEGRLDLGNIFPGDGPRYKGRGFVQITGRKNYTFFSGLITVTRRPVDLITNPDTTTDPSVAAIIIAFGMSNGSFTGRRLNEFGNDGQYDFFEARTIVNGHDKASSIAQIATSYRAIMR